MISEQVLLLGVAVLIFLACTHLPDDVKEALGDLLLLGGGAALVYAFLSIRISGGYQAVEPLIWALRAEIVLSWFMVLWGCNRYWRDL